jgi:alpha-N-arabinofuranosidase
VAKLTLFALNRSLDQALPLEVTAKGFAGLALEQALELRDDDLKAVNTEDDPERVRPAPLEGVTVAGAKLRATLAPASWNMIRLDVGG